MTLPAPGVVCGAEAEAVPYEFPRAARLLSARDYDRVFACPVRSRDAAFTVLARASDQSARLGLAIAKRQIASAAKRNRIKRRIRESFRYHRRVLYGIDVVVMAKRGVEAASSDAIDNSLDGHWCRIRRKLSA